MLDSCKLLYFKILSLAYCCFRDLLAIALRRGTTHFLRRLFLCFCFALQTLIASKEYTGGSAPGVFVLFCFVRVLWFVR